MVCEQKQARKTGSTTYLIRCAQCARECKTSAGRTCVRLIMPVHEPTVMSLSPATLPHFKKNARVVLPRLRTDEEYQQKRHGHHRDKADREAKKRPSEEPFHCSEYTMHKTATADAAASSSGRHFRIPSNKSRMPEQLRSLLFQDAADISPRHLVPPAAFRRIFAEESWRMWADSAWLPPLSVPEHSILLCTHASIYKKKAALLLPGRLGISFRDRAMPVA